MFTKSSVSQALIDATKAIMEASDKKLLLEPSKKMPAADKVPERVQAAISKKMDDKAAATGHSADVRESDEKNSPFNWKGKPSQLPKKPGESAGFDSKKTSTGTVYTKKYKKDKEEMKEAVNDNLHPVGAALLKHIKPEHRNLYKPHLTTDVFNGSFKDRHDVLSAAKQAGHLNEGTHADGGEEKEDKDLIKKMVKKSALKDKESKKEHDKESKSHEAKETKAHEMSEERHMTDDEMKKREHIVKSMKKGLSGFKARYGDRAKNVMYATATKQAMKEEVDQLDELSKGTLGSYVGKAYKDQGERMAKTGVLVGLHSAEHGKAPTIKQTKKIIGKDEVRKDKNRDAGMDRAVSRLSKEEVELEEALKGKQTKLDKNHNGKLDAQDFEILRKEDIGGISTMSEKKKEVKEAQDVRIEPNEDMQTKTVDTLAGRKKVGADYHNQTKSYKLKLNVEGKGTDVDPNFVTNESTPMKMAKDMAKKSFKKIRTETLGMACGTSEEKKKW